MLRPTRTSAIPQAQDSFAAPALAKPTLISVGTGIAIAGLVLAAPPADRLPSFLGAAGYLLLAIESDVRSLKIPNWLNGAGLVVALGLAGWLGGLSGFGTALAGAGAALAVGFVLFALGVIGAGDAKGVAVLGALFGLSALPGVLWWTVLAAGTLGIALILARGEAINFARRWWLMATAFLVTRKLFYIAPSRESAAATGLPFAVAMGLGTAASGVWGVPWSG
ncbi:MAG: hypothetical protein GY772_20755 [bacterium]|jgi:prepilin peptidase CpaA|nr:hypothetical protein [bacterium]MDP7300292.1 prepilin peptidase [Myxococcota bacterium]HJO24329.1 prepilin peptidase [Myxococcota bacterium]